VWNKYLNLKNITYKLPECNVFGEKSKRENPLSHATLLASPYGRGVQNL
jgi:hypothetical protein